MSADNLARSVRLPVGWFTCTVQAGVDVTKAGLYEWRIEGVGSYIGKYGRIRRPMREYGRNVSRLLNGRPYRKGNPNGFRRIHHALAMAHCYGTPIRLILLENVEPDRINSREREVIAERGELNDPPFGRS